MNRINLDLSTELFSGWVGIPDEVVDVELGHLVYEVIAFKVGILWDGPRLGN